MISRQQSPTLLRLSVKVGDLVRYAEWHKNLQHLTGLVVETRSSADGQNFDRARVLWSATRPGHVRWDWIEELRIVNESR